MIVGMKGDLEVGTTVRILVRSVLRGSVILAEVTNIVEHLPNVSFVDVWLQLTSGEASRGTHLDSMICR
jgi:hypothetical protein